jgi:hypothetical protein
MTQGAPEHHESAVNLSERCKAEVQLRRITLPETV